MFPAITGNVRALTSGTSGQGLVSQYSIDVLIPADHLTPRSENDPAHRSHLRRSRRRGTNRPGMFGTPADDRSTTPPPVTALARRWCLLNAFDAAEVTPSRRRGFE